MAGVVPNQLVDKLTAKLTDKLMQEVSLAANYKADLQSMCEELVAIKSLLKDVKDNTNPYSVTNWLQKLQAFLIDAVETVEKCDEQEAKNKFMFFCGNPFFSWQMVRKVRELRKRISAVHANGEKYIRYLASVIDVNARAHDSAFSQAKKSSAFPPDDLKVGMDDDIKTITKMVMEEDIGEQGPRVIAVLGMAGIGKTLLVRQVFHTEGIEGRFDHRFWLPVTQIFDIKELLHGMWWQIEEDDHDNANMLSEHSTESLRRHIHRKLVGKCCLFVLDDVWQKDILEQIGLSLGTSEGIDEKKSKIVVSTRDKGVSDAVGAYYTHRMKHLSDSERLELFCSHAFRIKRNEPKKLPRRLEPLEQLILQKCPSLPLAIQEIGKSMAQVKPMLYNWQGHFNRLDEAVIMNKQVMPTLRLSYEGLPDHLKPCFLYFSSFSPNTTIKTEHLVYAWIAQEFVSVSSTGVVAYDVALSYLHELLDHCMIQKSEAYLDGQVRYQMEDMLHRLALSESQKEAKCLLMPAKDLNKFPPIEEYRGAHRISLVGNRISGTINEEMAIHSPRLRTLLLQQNRDLTSISKTLFHKLKYLVVLDLSETAITSLPRSMGNLKRLKFLNLSRTKISKLPKFLKSLRSLQYLDVRGCKDLKSLHSEIGEHKDLRYLNVQGCKKLVSLPPGISELRSLRSLLLVGVVNAIRSMEVKYLPHLQNLSFSFNQKLTSSSAESVAFIQNITGQGIRFLALEYLPSDECFEVKLGYMENLEILILRNCMLTPAPGSYNRFWNLRVLVLRGNASSYAALDTIPNLQTLSLSNNRSCRVLPQSFGEAHAFPELESLRINEFLSLNRFPLLDAKTMPKLKILILKKCKQLSLQPSDSQIFKQKKFKLITDNRRLMNAVRHANYGGRSDPKRSRSSGGRSVPKRPRSDRPDPVPERPDGGRSVPERPDPVTERPDDPVPERPDGGRSVPERPDPVRPSSESTTDSGDELSKQGSLFKYYQGSTDVEEDLEEIQIEVPNRGSTNHQEDVGSEVSEAESDVAIPPQNEAEEDFPAPVRCMYVGSSGLLMENAMDTESDSEME